MKRFMALLVIELITFAMFSPFIPSASALQVTLTVFTLHGIPHPEYGSHSYDSGSLVTCTILSPYREGGVRYKCIGWTGTGSVPSSGSGTTITLSITQDSSITWNWEVFLYSVIVFSAHGNPDPSPNVEHFYDAGSLVTCSVVSPVTEAGTVWTCTGWSGTGSAPPSGSGLSTSFFINDIASITWNWVARMFVPKLVGKVSYASGFAYSTCVDCRLSCQ